MIGVLRSVPLLPSLGTLAVVLALADCRRFQVCQGTLACDRAGVGGAPDDGGSGGAPAGGSAGSGGTAGALECTEPLLDCDESSLTGCETDTTFAPIDCGSCGTVCASACGHGECIAAETITGESGVVNAGITASTDHVYFLSHSTTDQTALRRMSKQDGVVTTVLDGLSREAARYKGLAFGLDRVYLIDRGELQSVRVTGLLSGTGSPLVDERVSTDVAPVVNGRFLYVWTSSGSLLRRELTSGTEEAIEPWHPDLVSGQPHLAPWGDELIVGTTTFGGPEPSWELCVIEWPSSTLVASGPGQLARMRTLSGSDFDVVWLVDRAEKGLPSELHGYNESNHSHVTLATETNFTDVCLAGVLMYGSFDHGHDQGIRVLARTAPSYATIGFRLKLAAMLCDGDSIYYYTASAPGLFRVSTKDLEP